MTARNSCWVRSTASPHACALHSDVVCAARQPLSVANVADFPGHIACDAASASEIVVPIMHGDALLGVLDIDSPRVGRCTEDDAGFLQQIVDILVSRSYGAGAQ